MTDEPAGPAFHAQPSAPRYRMAASWFAAATGALLLNSGLFGLMPGLTDRTPEKPAAIHDAPSVNIVRLKQPEPHARRKKSSVEPPENRPEKPKPPQKAVYRPKAEKQRLQLPFAVNPNLPTGPGAVPVISLETVSVGPPALKPSYGAGEIDSGLTPLAKAAPLYPLRARRRGIEGWVNVRFIVNEQGRVDSVDILAAEPKNIFEKSVTQCVSSWRFTPGSVGGVPVKTVVETTIRFELK